MDVVGMYRKELTFYQSYHRNRNNQIIHAVCVPVEWLSWLVILSCFHFEWVLTIPISIYYLFLPTPAKYVASAAHTLMAFISGCIFLKFGFSMSLKIAVFSQILSWLCQVGIGHYICEKNTPAMKDKLSFNSIVLSVLLAWDWA